VLILCVLALAGGCSNDPTTPADTASDQNNVLSGGGPSLPFPNDGTIVELGSGSVNGLAGAIAAAGSGGTVIVKPGIHTLSSRVMITSSVSIVGEDGAVLKLDTAPSPSFPATLDIGLHIKGVSRVMIQNLDIRPVGLIGGTAVVIEDSRNICIVGNKFANFQWSVIFESGMISRIEGNTISASPAWIDGTIPEADGIVVVNGFGVDVRDNSVSNALFGIWACGSGGRVFENYASGNFVGIMLCKVPEASFALPGGRMTGSKVAATGWVTFNNTSTDNLDAGYLVTDGANKNKLTNNIGGGNGTYDIELTGDTNRFGFLMPASFDNVVNAGSPNGIVIKDCGNDNIVNGGRRVDTDKDVCM
ncbi:MAG: right-handed parallel beta-helix repeat-containing protein, partial [Candidatus Krumholzibacteria bacterium]|nr:right-handed parallel beta-helix repeat-containing protein [Candidatus Krumholzibacteria bacterium]